MNCSRHENWHQSDIFSNPRMSRCLIFRHFPALLLPAITVSVYILMCEDVEIHQNLPTHLIFLFDRYIWDIKVNPHHHLVCRVHLVNPMCTGIDVLCQGDWCPRLTHPLLLQPPLSKSLLHPYHCSQRRTVRTSGCWSNKVKRCCLDIK